MTYKGRQEHLFSNQLNNGFRQDICGLSVLDLKLAIVNMLKARSNLSCKRLAVHVLLRRHLKLRVPNRDSGDFQRNVNIAVGQLRNAKIIILYKATNERLRLAVDYEDRVKRLLLPLLNRSLVGPIEPESKIPSSIIFPDSSLDEEEEDDDDIDDHIIPGDTNFIIPDLDTVSPFNNDSNDCTMSDHKLQSIPIMYLFDNLCALLEVNEPNIKIIRHIGYLSLRVPMDSEFLDVNITIHASRQQATFDSTIPYKQNAVLPFYSYTVGEL